MVIIWLDIANVDCYWVGAVPNLNPFRTSGSGFLAVMWAPRCRSLGFGWKSWCFRLTGQAQAQSSGSGLAHVLGLGYRGLGLWGSGWRAGLWAPKAA